MNIKTKSFYKNPLLIAVALFVLTLSFLFVAAQPSFAAAKEDKSFFGKPENSNKEGRRCGGKNSDVVHTKFNFGCLGPDNAPANLSPIMDLIFAFIRFLSVGVGIIIVGSIVLAGIQYSSSEGNPEATQAAKSRIQNSVIGLLLYIFAFSLIQFLVPGGIFT